MDGHGLGTTLYYADRSPRYEDLLRRSEAQRLGRLAAGPSLARLSVQRLGGLLVRLGNHLAGIGTLPEARGGARQRPASA